MPAADAPQRRAVSLDFASDDLVTALAPALRSSADPADSLGGAALEDLTRGWALAQAGFGTEALDHLSRTRDLLPAGSIPEALALTAVVECRLARGDLGEALSAGDGLAGHLDDAGVRGALAHHAHGEIAAALSEPERAAAHAGRIARRLETPPGTVDLVPWREGAALAALRTGDRPRAARLAREHLELQRSAGTSPYALARALRTVATTDADGERQVLLRGARAAIGPLPGGRIGAQIDTDLAGVLMLTPGADRMEALRLLRGAEEYAGRQELWPLQGRVRRLLDRLGESPRKVHVEALASLTASERRIACLAAEGLTNRRIAERLGVSVKAVEWHLSHVYRKLGISSRTRLAPTLGVPA